MLPPAALRTVESGGKGAVEKKKGGGKDIKKGGGVSLSYDDQTRAGEDHVPFSQQVEWNGGYPKGGRVSPRQEINVYLGGGQGTLRGCRRGCR